MVTGHRIFQLIEFTGLYIFHTLGLYSKEELILKGHTLVISTYMNCSTWNIPITEILYFNSCLKKKMTNSSEMLNVDVDIA